MLPFSFKFVSSLDGLRVCPPKGALQVGLNGGGCAKLHELGGLTISHFSKAAWERECIDLAELARLRRVEKLTVEEIAERVGRSSSGVKKALRRSRLLATNV